MTLNWTAETVRELLKSVEDPELMINIIDLGLVYDIEVTPEKNVNLTMTLTTPACPIGPDLEKEVNDILKELPCIGEIKVDWVFSPPWDPREHASEDGKLELGIW